MPEVNFRHTNRITVRRKHAKWRWFRKRTVPGRLGQFIVTRRGKTETIRWEMPVIPLGVVDDSDIEAWERYEGALADERWDRHMDDVWRCWNG